MTATTPTLGRRLEAWQPSKTLLAWACVASVAATVIVGFYWGGWVTGGTAAAMTKEASASARYELASSICVDRFQAASDAPAQLVALKALGVWDRRKFVETGGWATMPGKAEPGDRSASLCADRLAAL